MLFQAIFSGVRVAESRRGPPTFGIIRMLAFSRITILLSTSLRNDPFYDSLEPYQAVSHSDSCCIATHAGRSGEAMDAVPRLGCQAYCLI